MLIFLLQVFQADIGSVSRGSTMILPLISAEGDAVTVMVVPSCMQILERFFCLAGIVEDDTSGLWRGRRIEMKIHTDISMAIDVVVVVGL
jgi:hypothetical protein